MDDRGGLSVHIGVSSLRTPPLILAAFPAADHLFHFIGYFMTTLVLLLAGVWHPWRRRGVLARNVMELVSAMLLLGVGLEIGQLATYQRTPDAVDAVVNAVGVGVAFIAWRAARNGSALFLGTHAGRRVPDGRNW